MWRFYDIKYDLGIIADNYYNFDSIAIIHVRVVHAG